MSTAVFSDIDFQLMSLLLCCGVGDLSRSVKAIEADGIHAIRIFQQWNHVLKLPPAHEISMQQHDFLTLLNAKLFDLHVDTP